MKDEELAVSGRYTSMERNQHIRIDEGREGRERRWQAISLRSHFIPSNVFMYFFILVDSLIDSPQLLKKMSTPIVYRFNAESEIGVRVPPTISVPLSLQ